MSEITASELSIPALATKISSEAEAYELLESLRWNGEPVCPHCGVIGKAYYLAPKNGVSRATRTKKTMSERRVWKCGACRKQFSVLTGTVFHGTKVPIRTWLFVIFEMCASKNGVSASEIKRKYGLTDKTAWFMLHRIREAMKLDPLASLLSGTVVADETWYGGKRTNRPKHKRAPKQGAGAWANFARPTDKTPIMALVNTETGEVRSKVIPNVTGESLRSVIAENVDMPNTVLATDEHRPYRLIGADMAGHETVNHSRDEYVNAGGYGTNPAEGYFSQLKRSLDGTHHHVSTEHLDRYLAEFDYRYLTRELSDGERMAAVVNRAGGRRLSYKPLTNR
jgi:transposase-like protein